MLVVAFKRRKNLGIVVCLFTVCRAVFYIGVVPSVSGEVCRPNPKGKRHALFVKHFRITAKLRMNKFVRAVRSPAKAAVRDLHSGKSEAFQHTDVAAYLLVREKHKIVFTADAEIGKKASVLRRIPCTENRLAFFYPRVFFTVIHACLLEFGSYFLFAGCPDSPKSRYYSKGTCGASAFYSAFDLFLSEYRKSDNVHCKRMKRYDYHARKQTYIGIYRSIRAEDHRTVNKPIDGRDKQIPEIKIREHGKAQE